MNSQDKRKLLEQELKKITDNKISVTTSNSNWVITIKDKEIIVPQINNNVRRTSILANK
jgi:hypothetical protein